MASYSTPAYDGPVTERSAGAKFLIMILAGFMLSIPLVSTYLLNYDRKSRSEEARATIAQGWGGQQILTGPRLIIPYRTRITETVEENGKSINRTREGTAELEIFAEQTTINTELKPERRRFSIYEAVVYQATHKGDARFVLPENLAEREIPVGALMPEKAQLRFGLSDVRGLQGSVPRASLDGVPLKLKPGQGANGSGFHASVDATRILTGATAVDYSFGFRGNGKLALRPEGGETDWTVKSPWPSPSFKGDFLPTTRTVSKDGFQAQWQLGSLALAAVPQAVEAAEGSGDYISRSSSTPRSSGLEASVDLFEPVDIYNQVDRATKYGFLFIGFTFAALLMFDVIGGVKVGLIEYLLVGAGLVMFFVLLLAMAEVSGFAVAYTVAGGAVIGLITAYSAAILKSWARARWIGGLLTALYAVLYGLLSLEDFSLLIGSFLLFAALAAVMYLTRNIDWGARRAIETETASA